MFQSKRYGSLWKLYAIGMGMLVILIIPRQAAAQADAQRPLNQYERDAIKVVSDWTAALNAKDPDKMAEFAADDVRFRVSPVQQVRTGKVLFLCEMRQMTKANFVVKNDTYQATGDQAYTIVVQRRTDEFQGGARGPAGQGPGGPQGVAGEGQGVAGAPPNAASGRAGAAGPRWIGGIFVIQNGKIIEWLDVGITGGGGGRGGAPPFPPCPEQPQ